MGLGIVLVQEQHCGERNILQVGQQAKAGILICRSNITVSVLTHLSTPHCLGPEHPSWERILIGVDCNAHSPLWFCERRQYIGRGPETEYRRQRMEGFILGRGLTIHNKEDQPCTFAGPSGESNIDLTLSTKNLGGGRMDGE
ncbi:Retrovirus-related Pol polyprotein from type-1 retrotransposable element R1 [Eumeta japonica]|uniref:Retrovirus-related Pol polyprotein from type-1 retrotransposable element R1 n=1 Tax=Eumeta variegata TaxID=151549 RepID=A0A4C1U5A5_EUMVA|nr:Retrovirus-related Pol polyprotein from type-1 retrotransposable element R1 [Eumeta japonica]